MSAVPPARAKKTRKGKVNMVSHRYRVRILLHCGKETAGHTNTDEDVKGKMRTVTEINKEHAKTKGAHSLVTWCTYSPFETAGEINREKAKMKNLQRQVRMLCFYGGN